MRGNDDARVRRSFAAVLIFSVAVLAYSNTLFNGFAGDDHIVIVGNEFVQDPRHLLDLLNWRFYVRPHDVLVGSRPVFLFSLLVDRVVWGAHAWGYHVTNIVLHAANSVWVYALAICFAPASPLALPAGLVFALHPALTEAVNAASFRADLLAAFFLFTTVGLYWRARKGRPALWMGCSATAFALGLLAKETALIAPVMALGAELLWPQSEKRRQRIFAGAVGYGIVLCAFLIFWSPRFRYQNVPAETSLRSGIDQVAARLAPSIQTGLPLSTPHRGRLFVPSSPLWNDYYRDWGVRLWTGARSAWLYVVLLAYPNELVADRAPEISATWKDAKNLLGVASIFALIGGVFLLRRASPVSSFGLLWGLASFLLVSGIFPLANPVAERYLYAMTAGFAWVVSAAWAEFFWERGRRRWGLAAGALLLAAYGVRTFKRNFDWRNDEALLFSYRRAETISPRAHYARAMLRLGQGRRVEAIDELKEAVRIHPGYAEAWLALGFRYAEEGGHQAQSCFEKAAALSPLNPVIQFGFAQYLARKGDAAAAIERYRRALELEPLYLEAWVNLGALYRDQGQWAQARDCFDRALPLAGSDPVPFYSYGLLLERMRRPDQARAMFLQAVARDPAYRPARERLSTIK